MAAPSRTRAGERERAELEHFERAVQPPDLAVAQDGRRRAAPLQPVAQAKLVEEGDHATVGAEEVVIELVEPVRADLEARRQAAGLRLALEDGDARATHRQAARPDHPERAGPDHRHVRHRVPAPPSLS